ncbi:MAG TPA: phospholipase C, phosphocholine-specific [Puia sp.]|jgi:phospholipase C
MSDTRRDFLKKAALLSGAAGLSQILPASIQRALAIDAAEGSTWLDAAHVVILMQENRSFDHCFGTLRGVRGYNDPRVIDLPNQNKVWLQSNTEGQTYTPFRLDLKDTSATWMHSLPHSWSNQVDARNEGKYDQWLNVKRNSHPEYSHMPLTMGYHTREDLPFYYALADAFTVCDQNFCSSLTGTNPNRLYFWTGTVRPEPSEHARAHVWNDDMDYGTLHWMTFPERLEDNDISWKCYQNEVAIPTGLQGEEDAWLSNFQDNPLEFFAQYNILLHDRHVAFAGQQHADLQRDIAALRQQIAALPAGDAHIDHLQKNLRNKQKELAGLDKQASSSMSFDQLTEMQKNLHRKAFDTNVNDPHYRQLTDLSYEDNGTARTLKAPKGDVLHQFRHDVQTGQLPTISWLSAPENFSDHPSAPWYGAWYVSEVLDILTQNPEIWRKTIFILAYDENDGYFDHIPPFVAPHPHRSDTGKVSEGIDTRVEYVTLEQEQERKGFPEPFNRECSIGLGYRVPLVIASPWSKGGWVNSQVFDHTSTLQFLEKFLSHRTGKKIAEPNISDWRRTICGDLTSVFRPYNSETIPTPAFLAKDEFLESIHKAKFKKLPDDFKQLTPEEITAFNKSPQDSPYMARQEKGTRPSCALPYQLEVDGRLSKDRMGFEIVLHNNNEFFGDKTAGAPFNVYAPGKYAHRDQPGFFETLRTWSYGVKPGDTLTDTWPLKEFGDQHYHLRVYGPNGFFREFNGNATDPAVDIRPVYQRSSTGSHPLTGNIELHLTNNAKQPFAVTIRDLSYQTNNRSHSLPAGGSSIVVLPLEKSHSWYDFLVEIDGHPAFKKRYAGRVETGRPGISDPHMGRI